MPRVELKSNLLRSDEYDLDLVKPSRGIKIKVTFADGSTEVFNTRATRSASSMRMAVDHYQFREQKPDIQSMEVLAE